MKHSRQQHLSSTAPAAQQPLRESRSSAARPRGRHVAECGHQFRRLSCGCACGLLGALWRLGAELAAPGVISDAGGVDRSVPVRSTVGNGCGTTGRRGRGRPSLAALHSRRPVSRHRECRAAARRSGRPVLRRGVRQVPAARLRQLCCVPVITSTSSTRQVHRGRTGWRYRWWSGSARCSRRRPPAAPADNLVAPRGQHRLTRLDARVRHQVADLHRRSASAQDRPDPRRGQHHPRAELGSLISSTSEVAGNTFPPACPPRHSGGSPHVRPQPVARSLVDGEHVRLLRFRWRRLPRPPWSSQRSFRGIPASPAAAVPPARPQPSRLFNSHPRQLLLQLPVLLAQHGAGRCNPTSRGLRRSRWRASPVPPASRRHRPTSGSGARWGRRLRGIHRPAHLPPPEGSPAPASPPIRKQRILVLP